MGPVVAYSQGTVKHFSAEEYRTINSRIRYAVLALCLLLLAVLLSLPHACSHEQLSMTFFRSVPGSFILPGPVFAIPGQPLPLIELASAGVHTIPNGSREPTEGTRRLGPFTDSIRVSGGRITMMLGAERSYLSFPRGAVRTPEEITVWIEKTVAPNGEEVTVFEIGPEHLEFFGSIFLTFRSSQSNGTMEFLSQDFEGNWLRAAVAAVQQSHLTFPISETGRYAIGESSEEGELNLFPEAAGLEATVDSLSVRPPTGS